VIGELIDHEMNPVLEPKIISAPNLTYIAMEAGVKIVHKGRM
jgi:hypothetical protein